MKKLSKARIYDRARKWMKESGYDTTIQNWGIIQDAFVAGFEQAEKRTEGFLR